MKLAKYLAEIFEEELQNVIEKEKLEKEFLAHEDFESCRERAAAGVEIAAEKVINTLGYSIAIHREKEHGEDTMEEQVALLSAGAEAEVGTRAWWSQ